MIYLPGDPWWSVVPAAASARLPFAALSGLRAMGLAPPGAALEASGAVLRGAGQVAAVVGVASTAGGLASVWSAARLVASLTSLAQALAARFACR